MDKTQALQKLLGGTASEEEIQLLKQLLASGEISVANDIYKEKHERRPRWIIIVSMVVAIFLLVFGGLGWVNSQQSKSEAAKAQSNLYQAILAWGTASAQRDEAQSQAQAAHALQFASQAQKVFSIRDLERETAVLLAIQSMRMYPSGEAAQVLQDNTLMKPVSRMTHDWLVTSVAFSPDGKYVVSGSWDNTARVWLAGTGKEIARMVHSAGVYSVAFSPNGRYVASGGCDYKEGYSCSRGSARVWDAFTGREIARMEHDDLVTFVAFSPDGKHVVSGGCGKFYNGNLPCRENFARVWDVLTGKEIARLPHNFYVSSVAFSSDGKYIVSGGCDQQIFNGYCTRGFVRVWDVFTGRETTVMEHDGFVSSVAFSPNGKYVVSGSWDSTARVWDVLSGKEVARITQEYDVTSVAFSPDSRYVASGGRTAYLWEAATGREIAHIAPDDGASSVSFSSDGLYVATGGRSTARVWSATTGQEIARKIHGDAVTSVAFSPDGNYVASGIEDGVVSVWNITDQGNVSKIHHDKYVSSFAFSSNGRYVVSWSEDQTLRVWEVPTGKEIFHNMLYGSYLDSVAISPDGRYVVLASHSQSYDWSPWVNTISVWDVLFGERVALITQKYVVTSVAFSPDGKHVVSGGYDSTVRVWEVSTGKEIAHMTIEGEVFISSVAISPNGRYVAAGGGIVRVWEIFTGKEISRMTPYNGVQSIAFSLDSKYVVTGEAFTVHVWEASTGKDIARMTHEDGVLSVAFSPDSKYVVSGGGNTVRVWDATTGQEFARMTRDGVKSVAFSSDGKYIFSGSYLGTVRVWKWRPDDLIADACSRVTRNLTRAEWQQYIGNVLPYQAVCPNFSIEPEPVIMPIVMPTSYTTATPDPTSTPYPISTPNPTETP